LGGRTKEELLIILRNEEQEHRADSGIGVICITSGSDSRDMAFSGGGARSGLPFRRRCQLAARAVSAATLSHRAVGFSDHVGVRLARRGSFRPAARQQWKSPLSGTVDAAGLFTRLRHHSLELVGNSVVGLVSNSELKPPE
jgi:hypothetical protein